MDSHKRTPSPRSRQQMDMPLSGRVRGEGGCYSEGPPMVPHRLHQRYYRSEEGMTDKTYEDAIERNEHGGGNYILDFLKRIG